MSILIRGIAALGTAAMLAGVANAQTQYHDLDAGKPLRIEDASATRRFALDLDMAPFQIERVGGGMTRYRAEPRLAYGVLPFTELELRAPLVAVQPPAETGANAVAGLAAVSIGVLHAFNIETTGVPAFAISAEASVPAGGLRASNSSFLIKGLITKTSALGRFHVNAGAGTFALRPPHVQNGCAGWIIPGATPADTTTCLGTYPIVIDMPCNVAPSVPGRLTVSRCMAAMADSVATPNYRTNGARWFAGLAFDRALPLQSTLIAVDLFAERFVGLYPLTDWTAEIGLRRQLTPQIVLDVGAGRRFAGTTQSTTITLGATYEMATRPWH